jgi:carbon monoxide dehydrogenase subunit G
MATESFSRTLATTSDAGTCWAVLTDVSRVAGWVTVVGEVNEIEPLAKYSTVLMDKVGPFKLKADLDIKVPEVQAPYRIRITAAGEDRQVASRIAIDATLEIKDAGPGGAEVDVSGSYSVTGRVASMAPSQVKRKADKILEEFFTQAGQELGTASLQLSGGMPAMAVGERQLWPKRPSSRWAPRRVAWTGRAAR